MNRGVLVLWGRVKKYGLVVLRMPYKQAALLVCCLVFLIIVVVVLHSLHTKVDQHREEQRMLKQQVTEAFEQNAELLTMLEVRLHDRLEEAEQFMFAVISGRAVENLEAIRVLDAGYRSLLSAQERRTLESFQREDALIVQRREAAAAFSEGRYMRAHQLFGNITEAHPHDQEARFFQYYALFLSNRQNRDNHRRIWNVMRLLERQGYTRRELTETLNFITEESGITD